MEKTNLLQRFEAQAAMLDVASENAGLARLATSAKSCLYMAVAVAALKEALTDEMMDAVIMPLMNTKAGFLTDRRPTKKNPNPIPYTRDEVRSCVIDAIQKGLQVTGNQFNIIAGQVYITREGYAHLLKKMGVKHYIVPGQEEALTQSSVKIPVKINGEYRGDRISFSIDSIQSTTGFSTPEQRHGKAYAKGIKTLYVYVSGIDDGDVVTLDEEPRTVVDVKPQEVRFTDSKPAQPSAGKMESDELFK